MLDLGLIWASPANGLPPFGARGSEPGRHSIIHDSVETSPAMAEKVASESRKVANISVISESFHGTTDLNRTAVGRAVA